MIISSIKEAENILHSLIKDSSRLGDGQTLVRMWPLLEAAGDPHEQLRVIHIAGTSGKTSTCYFIASLLKASGKKVGLTVSPHIDSITERVQIDGKHLDDDVFCKDLAEFLTLVGDQQQSSYFEMLIVFILWEFVRHGVEYVVLETGLGGLLDGTNVVSRQDKVCVITDIGFDHMHVLGNTLPEIAAQKAGIIHEKNVVFTHEQSSEILTEIQNRADSKKSDLNVIGTDAFAGYAKKLQIPSFQARNWALAKEVAVYVSKRDGFELVNVDPSSIVIPARMETKNLPDGSVLIMDGAHNAQKMNMFISSFQEKYPDEKATVLLALKKGKEFQGVINALKPVTSRLIVTTFTAFQDLPFTSQDPGVIAQFALDQGIDTTVINDCEKAYRQLLQSNNNVKIITGSFYLIGQVRSI